MKRNWMYLLSAGLISLLLSGSLTYAEGSNDASVGAVNWEAKEIDGEVYVKASALLHSLGGTGAFDREQTTYSYTPNNRVAEAIQKTSPSVVAIIGKPTSSFSATTDDRFQLAHGTGIIVKSDGLIITNAHVVKDMKNIVVVTADGKQYSGKTTNVDEESDLALVRIQAKDLPEATFADKLDVQVGETVIAIGTPISFALRNSVTVGVVSGIDRSIHSTYRLLQTDAAINPGNSGGALVNLKGHVIGINSLKFAAVGVDSLGFAIPVDTVHYVLNQFLKYGKVLRPALGFELEESWAAVVGLPTDEPLKVTRVETNSAAGKAGIKEGDLLYAVDNVNVGTLIELNELLKNYLPNDQAKLMMQSNGDLVQRDIVFGEEKK